MKEGSSWGFYLFECFVEYARKPRRWTGDTAKDFVVIGGGKGEIAIDVVEGRSVDFVVGHTMKRMIEGRQG